MKGTSGSESGSNLQRLIDAEVVNADATRDLDPDLRAEIEKLSSDEMKVLIRLRQKLGEVPVRFFLI